MTPAMILTIVIISIAVFVIGVYIWNRLNPEDGSLESYYR